MKDTEFTNDELKQAARDYMKNLREYAVYLKNVSAESDINYNYFKAVCENDFDNIICYGMAYGNDYEIPEEYR